MCVCARPYLYVNVRACMCSLACGLYVCVGVIIFVCNGVAVVLPLESALEFFCFFFCPSQASLGQCYPPPNKWGEGGGGDVLPILKGKKHTVHSPKEGVENMLPVANRLTCLHPHCYATVCV